MAQLEEAAAVAEAEVATDDSVETTTAPTDAHEQLYADDLGEPEPDAEDDIDGEDGQDPEPEPVDAPASLRAEEKDKFAQLPAEAQRLMSEVLQRRDRETQQGLESARAAQREAETRAADHVAQAQAQNAEVLDRFVRLFAPEPPNPELMHQDFQRWSYENAVYEQNAGQFQQIIAHVAAQQQQSAQHFQARDQEANDARIKGLMTIPEIADESTRTDFITGIQSVGEDLGYDVQSLAQMDSRDMVALKRAKEWKADAEKWRQHVKKRNERPRQAQGRFQSAPGGARAPGNQRTENDTLRALYPND